MSTLPHPGLQLSPDGALLTGAAVAPYLSDATETRGLRGHAEVVALPACTEDVVAVMQWCYRSGVPITPRGGGTGYAGGAVPDGGLVLCTERLRRVRSLAPLQWRAEVEAGLPTAQVQRLARENGLYFPPDPGAAEQSQIGGNVATNAGGPHAFKYGVTGAWVTGLEVVVAPGEVVTVGGPVRKDVAGYDLCSVLVGSEGTLAVITAVHLRFIPAVESRFPVVAFFADVAAGARAVEACFASGVVPAALEYLDEAAMEIVRDAFPAVVPAPPPFAVIAEADGSREEALAGQALLAEALGEGALKVLVPTEKGEIDALWRWREGVGIAADAARGGKVSEDIVVPVERLGEAIEGTRAIAGRHRVETCNWGHAGDGNLHATFLFSRGDEEAVTRATAAAEELFEMAVELGGTISGEHGIGLVKGGHLRRNLPAEALRLQAGVKELFDPRGLLNPGKKAI